VGDREGICLSFVNGTSRFGGGKKMSELGFPPQKAFYLRGMLQVLRLPLHYMSFGESKKTP